MKSSNSPKTGHVMPQHLLYFQVRNKQASQESLLPNFICIDVTDTKLNSYQRFCLCAGSHTIIQ